MKLDLLTALRLTVDTEAKQMFWLPIFQNLH